MMQRVEPDVMISEKEEFTIVKAPEGFKVKEEIVQIREELFKVKEE